MKNWQRIAKNEGTLKKNLEIRMATIKALRSFFDENGYYEVETPAFSKAGEQNAHIDQFLATNTENPNEQYYLASSPEYSMKKLLAAGYEKIYQICKSFRAGEPPSKHHLPEFTILEWYNTNATLLELAKETEELLKTVAATIHRQFSLDPTTENIITKIQKPWKQASVRELFEKYTTINLNEAIRKKTILDEFLQKQYGTQNAEAFSWDESFHQIFLNEIEPHLGKDQSDIITHFPYQLAALAQKDPTNPLYALRFELYIENSELANAFQELRDPEEQYQRFLHEQQQRRDQKKTVYPIDKEFVEALEWGIPQTAGIAFGVDRFIMLLCGTKDIRETVWFPFE